MTSFHHLSIFILVSFASTHLSKGFSVFDYEYEIEQCDKYIDEFISEMINEGEKKFNPYRLEDMHFKNMRIPFMTNIQAEIKVSHGHISGFESLRRLDQCNVDLDGDRSVVWADFVAGPLKFHYDGAFKINHDESSVTVYKVMDQVEFHVQISVDAETGANATLKDFQMTNIKSSPSKITGLKTFQFVSNLAETFMDFWFQTYLNIMVEDVKKYVAEKVSSNTFPVIESDF